MALTSVAPAHSTTVSWRDLLQLTKPGIVVSNALAAAAGAAVAPAPAEVLPTASLLAGTALLVASAGVWNMIKERDVDALMGRTEHRPLAAGRIAVHAACVLGSVTLAGGVALLAAGTNALCLMLGVLALALYVFAYTPLKRRTPWSLPIGALAGALPPLMGGAALTGTLDGAPLWTAAWVFAWQFPHFLSLAAARRAEYHAAGLRVLPAVGGPGLFRALLVLPALALPALSLALAASTEASALSTLALVATAAPLPLAALRPWRGPIEAACRPIFFASLWSLCAFLAVCIAIGV